MELLQLLSIIFLSELLVTAASCIWYTRNADMPISFIWDVSASFQKDLWQIFNKLTTIGVTSGYGFAYPSRTHEITTVVLDVRAAQSLDLGSVFCRSLFALLSFFVLSFVLHVLLRITLLVTPLIISHLKVVSSNHDHGEGPLDKTLYGKVFQTVATDRWFSQWILVSSTNKTDIHDRP